MRESDANELLAFDHVRVLNVMAGALRCLIGDQRVWLPREHIEGILCRRGDSGRLLVRRWVAVDRNLPLAAAPTVVRLTCQPFRSVLRPRRLRLVRSGRVTNVD